MNKTPSKLANLIKLTLKNTTANVKVNNTHTLDFRVDSGVKQGDPPSPTLFNPVIDTVLKQLDLKGNISTRLRQLVAYADNLLIITRTKQSLIDTLQQIKSSSMDVGLRINEEKTKYLKCSKKDTSTGNLTSNDFMTYILIEFTNINT